MHLTSLCLEFEVDDALAASDKDRIFRSIRDKINQKFRTKVVSTSHEDSNSLFIAFFDVNFQRGQSRATEIINFTESLSEVRIRTTHTQMNSWFEGEFVITNSDSPDYDESHSKKPAKTIVYDNPEEDDPLFSLPNRNLRRNLRIPTRK